MATFMDKEYLEQKAESTRSVPPQNNLRKSGKNDYLNEETGLFSPTGSNNNGFQPSDIQIKVRYVQLDKL